MKRVHLEVDMITSTMSRMQSVKSKARVKYETDPKKKKALARAQYQCHAESKKAAARAQYVVKADSKKAAARAQYVAKADSKIAASRARYVVKCNSIKAAARALYKIHPGRKRAVARTASRISYAKNCIAKINTAKQYYVSHKRDVCLAQKARYILAPPKPDVKELYVKEMQGQLLGDDEARAELMTTFKKLRGSVTKPVCRKVVCRIAAKRLLNKALQIRKEHSASLLKCIRSIKSIQINGRQDFGKDCHTVSNEPYFYDSSYQLVKRVSHTH